MANEQGLDVGLCFRVCRAAYLLLATILFIAACDQPARSGAANQTTITPPRSVETHSLLLLPAASPGTGDRLAAATVTATPTAAATATPAPSPTPLPPSPTRLADATATPILRQATPTLPVPPTVSPVPQQAATFSDVSQRTPAEVVSYLRGRLAGYAGQGSSLLLDFSPSDILETMDTVVLDVMQRQRGDTALLQAYDIIAKAILDTLREQYPVGYIVVPLEAGHGGKKGYNFDPGSEGTEARHNRGVVAAMVRQAQAEESSRLFLRPIHNDDVAEDFALMKGADKPIVSRMLLRQARASMLAMEVSRWSRGHGDPRSQAVAHEISVHFNAGAQSAMVLHQGGTVRPEFAERSLDFARRYLRRVVADLNSSQLLPDKLRLWSGNGLHDDVMMYQPEYLSPADMAGITLRYAALQGGGYLPRYADMVVENSSLP